MSFDNNLDLILKIANAMPNDRQLIVFYTGMELSRNTIESLTHSHVRVIHFSNDLKFVFGQLPVLLSSRLILCDNYFPFLGGLILPKVVEVIQLWHADGAVKQFGWGDPRTKLRSKSDRQRFQAVYDHFDQYVVASKAMGQVFSQDYHVPLSRMRYLGYPRSDRFFDRSWIIKSRREVYHKIPQLKNRRVILYAPTYREGVTYNPPRHLIDALTCDPNAVVIVRLHPALRSKFLRIERQIGSSSRLIYLNDFSTAKLLTVADTLVTDYSSVAFDYSLLPNAHSMIFFTFDLRSYEKSPGCQPDFLKWLPDRPVTTVHKLGKVIRAHKKTNFRSFNLLWNTYNDGRASHRFINQYIEPLRRRN